MRESPVTGSVVRSHDHGQPATYRVTAVRGDRVYVDHLSGYKFCRGIHGWENLWFMVDDDRFEVIDDV